MQEMVRIWHFLASVHLVPAGSVQESKKSVLARLFSENTENDPARNLKKNKTEISKPNGTHENECYFQLINC